MPSAPRKSPVRLWLNVCHKWVGKPGSSTYLRSFENIMRTENETVQLPEVCNSRGRSTSLSEYRIGNATNESGSFSDWSTYSEYLVKEVGLHT